MLGRRELSSRQLADRLRRKGFPPEVIETALASLRESGALNDARAAAARARHDVTIHRHGQVSRAPSGEGAGRGRRDGARLAVSAAFTDVSEDQMLANALARKLRGAEPPSDPKAVRRLQGWLLRQGFDPDKVQRLLRGKFRVDRRIDVSVPGAGCYVPGAVLRVPGARCVVSCWVQAKCFVVVATCVLVHLARGTKHRTRHKAPSTKHRYYVVTEPTPGVPNPPASRRDAAARC